MDAGSNVNIKPIRKQTQQIHPNENSTKKTSNKFAHFDEQNLAETYHPEKKDYGFMTITESKTPFPRNEPAVDAEVLRNKLMAMNSELLAEEQVEETSSSESSKCSIKESFESKRKKFYASEFLIAKQRLLGNELHAPGETIEQSLHRLSDIQSQIMLHRSKNSIW